LGFDCVPMCKTVLPETNPNEDFGEAYELRKCTFIYAKFVRQDIHKSMFINQIIYLFSIGTQHFRALKSSKHLFSHGNPLSRGSKYISLET